MNTPRLRFKGFKDEWENIFIGKVLDENKELKNGKSKLPIATSSRKGLFLQSDYFNGKRSYDTDDINFKVVPRGFITYRHMSDDSTFHFNVNELADEILVSPEYPVFTTKENSDTRFILYHLNSSSSFKNFCVKQKLGGTRTRLYYKKLEKYKLYIPSKYEQQKISSLFKHFDKKIEKQQEKIEKLEELKKGMMQKIFSQELRFKDENGEEFRDWGSKRLDQISEVIMGQSPKGENYSTDTHNIVLIQGNADMKNGKVIPRIYTSEITKTCMPGDIIMSVRAPVGEIALTDITACIGRGVCAIRGSKFLYHYLFYFNLINAWNSLSQGSTFESVNGNDIKTLVIPTPTSSEQTRIENYLTTLDRKIEKEKEKVLMLEEQKKGFMQRVFV